MRVAAPSSSATSSCVWCHNRYGPRTCTSTNRRGGSHSWISVSQRTGTPCRRSAYWRNVPTPIDTGSGVSNRNRRQRRRDRLEVAGVGEEREDDGGRRVQPQLAPED